MGKREINWAAIRVDYEVGAMSNRAIGKKHGVSHEGIAKRAKRDSWSGDLKKRIRDRAEERVAKCAVAAHVAKHPVSTEVSTEKGRPELETGNHLHRVKAALREQITQEWSGTFTRVMTLVRDLLVLEAMLNEVDDDNQAEQKFAKAKLPS